MNSIETMLVMFLLFSVGLLLGFIEGMAKGWRDCGLFYREEVLPATKKVKR